MASLSVVNRDNNRVTTPISRQSGLRDQLPYAVLQAQLRVSRYCCAALMALRCWWWRVEVGSGARYFGLLQLRRHPLGRMTIGRHNTFRSSKMANPLLQAGPCAFAVGQHAHIQIGDHCGFSGTTLLAQTEIVLGQRVLCGANVLICDGDHHSLDATARAEGAVGPTAPVHIGDDVWLGMNVVVLKGVTIGAGAVIAANAVVSSDIPAGAIAGGVPAKVIGWVGEHA